MNYELRQAEDGLWEVVNESGDLATFDDEQIARKGMDFLASGEMTEDDFMWITREEREQEMADLA